MSRLTKAILVVSLAVIVGSVGFLGGFAASHALPARLARLAPAASAVATVPSRVEEVYKLMQDNGLVQPTETSATADAIQGLLDSTGDKYGTYYDATHYKAFNENTQGSFGGIGVLMSEENSQTVVMQVYPDTPASKAGIMTGDIFRVINGERRKGWTSADVSKLVRGEIGTPVTVTMFRPAKGGKKGAGSEKTFSMVRATINYPNIKSEMIGHVGYMRLGEFNANSTNEIRSEVTSLTKAGATSLILDLRGNPGGLLNQAVDVTSLFVDDGVIVRVDERNKPESAIRARHSKMTDLPLVVLIDGMSASASEIAGGALQDYGRATLVGEKSFGKGSVQTAYPLSWGGAVKFTVAHYLTPKGRTINGVGLTPDVVVKMSQMKQMKRSTDIQLKKAIAIANEKAAGR